MLTTARRGMSLVELLVVVGLLAVAGGALSRIAVRQQDAYRDLALRSLALGQLREGAEVLASALAGLAPLAGDIYAGEMLDESIAVRAPLGSYVLCRQPTGSEIDLIPTAALGRDRELDLSIAAESPAIGDSLWLYAEGRPDDPSDDGWTAHIVYATTPARRECPPAGDTGDVAVHRVSIEPAPRADVAPHAPARAFRRTRYALYRSSDGSSYLGFSDCRPIVRAPACAPMQPVAGPYLQQSPAGSSRPSGLHFLYQGASGDVTDDATAVATIEITLRAAGPASDPRPAAAEHRRLIVLRNAAP